MSASWCLCSAQSSAGRAGEWRLHTVANLYAPTETDPGATAF